VPEKEWKKILGSAKKPERERKTGAWPWHDLQFLAWHASPADMQKLKDLHARLSKLPRRPGHRRKRKPRPSETRSGLREVKISLALRILRRINSKYAGVVGEVPEKPINVIQLAREPREPAGFYSRQAAALGMAREDLLLQKGNAPAFVVVNRHDGVPVRIRLSKQERATRRFPDVRKPAERRKLLAYVMALLSRGGLEEKEHGTARDPNKAYKTFSVARVIDPNDSWHRFLDLRHKELFGVMPYRFPGGDGRTFQARDNSMAVGDFLGKVMRLRGSKRGYSIDPFYENLAIEDPETRRDVLTHVLSTAGSIQPKKRTSFGLGIFVSLQKNQRMRDLVREMARREGVEMADIGGKLQTYSAANVLRLMHFIKSPSLLARIAVNSAEKRPGEPRSAAELDSFSTPLWALDFLKRNRVPKPIAEHPAMRKLRWTE
jgi:hypothetical protein